MTLANKLHWFWDGLDAYLSRNALKQTKQRKMIVEHFLNIGGHVDAEELYDAVKKESPSVGLATVYRTLNLLRDAGLVEQKSFADGRAVFELLFPDAHHDHLICIECGTIVEFQDLKIEELQEKIAVTHGFHLTSHRLDLFGRCSPCRKKNKASAGE